MASLPQLSPLSRDVLAGLSHVEQARRRRRHDVRRGAYNVWQLDRLTRPRTLARAPGIPGGVGNAISTFSDSYDDGGNTEREENKAMKQNISGIINTGVEAGVGINTVGLTQAHDQNNNAESPFDLPPLSKDTVGAGQQTEAASTLPPLIPPTGRPPPASVRFFTHPGGTVSVFPPFLPKPEPIPEIRSSNQQNVTSQLQDNDKNDQGEKYVKSVSKSVLESEVGPLKQPEKKLKGAMLYAFPATGSIFNPAVMDYKHENTMTMLKRVDQLLLRPSKKHVNRVDSSVGVNNQISGTPLLSPLKEEMSSQSSQLLRGMYPPAARKSLVIANGVDFTDHLKKLPKTNHRYALKCREWLRKYTDSEKQIS